LSRSFRINKHEEVYRGFIVNLTVDHITTASGITTVREVFHHPGGAAVVPVLPNGNILLVRQFRYPIQQDLLELPAGKIDPGETPESTARRELAEEIGYHAGVLEKLAEFYTTPGFCTERLHLYLAKELTPTKEQGDDDEEIIVEQFSLSELKSLLCSGRITDAKTIIGIQYLLLNSA
jgi:ADP-ribose diphosphatase